MKSIFHHFWRPSLEKKKLFLKVTGSEWKHVESAYAYQTWQYEDLPWETPTHKFPWSFDHVVLQDHQTRSQSNLKK